MDNLGGCQIPSLQKISYGNVGNESQSLGLWIRRALAKPWNYHVKKYLKRLQKFSLKIKNWNNPASSAQTIRTPVAETSRLKPGDWVRVRSREEIQATLNSWKELKGCAFLDEMWQYCDTTQQVLQSMERFLDERDYKVKKCKGIILLKGVLCQGTPVFGRCDRCCHFFWREEWLEIIHTGVPVGNDIISG